MPTVALDPFSGASRIDHGTGWIPMGIDQITCLTTKTAICIDA